MATREQEIKLEKLGIQLRLVLDEIYGKRMGFILNVSQFGSGESVADYVTNVSRDTAIGWLVDASMRLADNEDIPAGGSEA